MASNINDNRCRKIDKTHKIHDRRDPMGDLAEAIKVLTNLRSLRARVKTGELPLETLEEIIEKASVVVEEQNEAMAAQEAEMAERREKLEQYREMLVADGIDPDELLATLSKAPKAKRAKRPIKYKLVTEDKEVTWTGQGRTPNAIKEYLDSGGNLEDLDVSESAE